MYFVCRTIRLLFEKFPNKRAQAIEDPQNEQQIQFARDYPNEEGKKKLQLFQFLNHRKDTNP